MERVTLGNRPEEMAVRTKIEDFITDDGIRVRVSIRLEEALIDTSNNNIDDPVRFIRLDAQAFEVRDDGVNKIGPDGRPSRTPSSGHTVIASALGDTHTLAPGWVRIVGDYDDTSFDETVPRAAGKPTAAPDFDLNPQGKSYDAVAGVAYEWVEGETLRVARAKVAEMVNIIRNSNAIAGIEF